MGYVTFLMDGGGKLRKAGNMRITVKRPTAGLDFVRLTIDSMFKGYQSYLKGWIVVDDQQAIAILKRSTPAGFAVGYITVSNGKIIAAPTDELMRNIIMNEVRSRMMPAVFLNLAESLGCDRVSQTTSR